MPVVLLSALVVMLVPLLSAHLLDEPAILAWGIPLASACVAVILALYHARRWHALGQVAVLVVLTIACAQLVPVWLNVVRGDVLHVGDLVNVVAKPVNFLVLVALFQYTRPSPRQIRTLTSGFVVIVTIVAVYGLLTGLDSFFGLGIGTSSYAVSYSSFLANRNQFGMLLFLGFGALLVTRAVRGHRKGDLVVGAVLVVSVALTMSRGSILAMLIVAGVILAFKRLAVLVVFLVPTALLGVVLVWLQPSVRAYVLHFFVRPDVGLTGRDEIWAIGLGLFADRPLFGYGFFNAVARAEESGMSQGQFHSFWLDQVLDWGIVGTVLVVVIVARIWARAYTSSPRAVGQALVAVGAGAMALGTVESISLLSIGYVDFIWTLCLMTFPVLVSRTDWSGGPQDDDRLAVDEDLVVHGGQRRLPAAPLENVHVS
ncbi:O-antigen ligase family protein [Ornithinimicrobium sediminis]|uniref:O-antigen ligase family protein n=1 Tax=Ornithinimicrobium sediminis TaxID=2904603 RepID=UPI001E5E3118|nr:O-antigen ligase family protein [Ornithinimicrobium sediminis]MCE0485987.1 O-antigen ligase family protein [Ornithinimicrobium sediminis]